LIPISENDIHNAMRERELDINHHREADDGRAGFEVSKGGTFCHPATLGGRPARLKKISSDSARQTDSGIFRLSAFHPEIPNITVLSATGIR
jgi:hypothetical protein